MASAGWRRYVPARYVFAVISMLGSFLFIVLRTSLPIAMTGMVKSKNASITTSDNVSQSDTCHFGTATHDESPARVMRGGDFDWDEVTQSYILTAGGYGILASSVIGARVAELWSAKYLYAICCFVSTAVFLVLPLIASWSVVVLIVTQVLGGLFLAGYFCALPQVAAWTSSVTFGFLSQWIRRKKYISHLRTYHLFNGIATLGTAALVLCLPLVQCNSAATITILCLAVATSGAYIGGSQLNHMDLAVNYAGTLSGWSATLSTVVSILATTISGMLTNNQQTLTAWNKVFYVAAAVNIVPFFIYLIFGSVDEQPWNRAKQADADNIDKTEAAAVDVDLQ